MGWKGPYLHSVHSTVFSVLAMVHRQRLALLHIQSSSPHVANNIAEGISRLDYAAGSLGLFSKLPEQFHLRQQSLYRCNVRATVTYGVLTLRRSTSTRN